jgi:hypothetical protein
MIIDKTDSERRYTVMSNVIDALKKGWTVSEVATVLAHGQNDEGRGFLVTLVESKSHMSREMYLPYSTEIETFLKRASTPLVA